MKQETRLRKCITNHSGDPFEIVPVRVYSVKTKTLLFIGTRRQLATMLQVPKSFIVSYIRSKSVFRKKYAFRNGSDQDRINLISKTVCYG